MKSNHGPYLDLTLAMLIVGTSFVAGKLIATSLPIFLSTFLSLLVATILFSPTIIHAIQQGSLKKRDYLYIGLQALLGTALYRIFLFIGLQYVTASYAGILTALQPAIISLLAFFFLKERPSRREWFGMILAITGLIITYLASINAMSISTGLFLGSVLILLATFGTACFNVFAKKLDPSITPMTIASLITAVSCVLLLPLAAYDVIANGLPEFTPLGISLILYYGIIITYLSFIFWFRGLKKVKVSVAGIFTALAPIFGVLLSVLFLRETPEILQLVGGVLIVISIILVVYQDKK